MIRLDSIWQPARQQVIFRSLLRCISHPGKILDLSHSLDGSEAALGLLAALLDHTTTFCDVHDLLTDQKRAMLEAPEGSDYSSDFLLCDAGKIPPQGFYPRLGTVYRPDEGATLILAGERIGAGSYLLDLTGPGVASTSTLRLSGFAPQWISRREDWVSQFPMGVDFILCDPFRVAALPRTTQVRCRDGGL